MKGGSMGSPFRYASMLGKPVSADTSKKLKATSEKDQAEEERKRRNEKLGSAIGSFEAGDIETGVKLMQEAGETTVKKPPTNWNGALLDGSVTANGENVSKGPDMYEVGEGGSASNAVVDPSATFDKLQAKFKTLYPEHFSKVTEVRDVEGPGGKRQTVLSSPIGLGDRAFDQAPKEATPKAPPAEGDLRESGEGDSKVWEEFAGGKWVTKSRENKFSPEQRTVKRETTQADKETERLDKARMDLMKHYDETYRNPLTGQLNPDAPELDQYLDENVKRATGGRVQQQTAPFGSDEDIEKTIDTADWTDDEIQTFSDELMAQKKAGEKDRRKAVGKALAKVVERRKKGSGENGLSGWAKRVFPGGVIGY